MSAELLIELGNKTKKDKESNTKDNYYFFFVFTYKRLFQILLYSLVRMNLNDREQVLFMNQLKRIDYISAVKQLWSLVVISLRRIISIYLSEC